VHPTRLTGLVSPRGAPDLRDEAHGRVLAPQRSQPSATQTDAAVRLSECEVSP